MKTMDLDYLRLYFDDDDGKGAEENNGGTNPETEKDNDNKGGKTGTSDKNTPKYTDADLDKIIDRKFAKWQKQQKEAVDEATRLANMSAQERAEHERDNLQKELDQLKREKTIAEMEKTARNILTNDGVTIPDVIVSALVSDDADSTSNNVKAFSKAFKSAVQAEVKRQLSHKSPTTGFKGGTLTKEDIFKIDDPIKQQQAIEANLSLFR